MKSITRWARDTQKSAALCLLSVLPALALAAGPVNAGVNFAGTWKINAPQASLKPAGAPISFTQLGKQIYQENQRYRKKKEFDRYDQMQSRCASPGMPRVMLTSQRFQIFQRADLIMFAFEWNRVRRVIRLPGLPPQEDRFAESSASLVGTTMGTSKGRWEGDTLVVATDMFSEGTLIDELVPHGYDLKVTERLRLTDAQTLEDRITIEDPEYFTRPWETVVIYKRQPDAVIPEDVCLDRLQGPPPLPTR